MIDFPYQTARWFVIQVVPRHEKKAALLLGSKGILHLLPMYNCKRKWSDRIKSIQQPLFPGYVFCKISQRSAKLVLSTPGVRKIVGFGGKPFPVSDEEMDAVQKIIRCGKDLRPDLYLRVGERVRVKDGPLEGVTGILVQFKNQHRLVILIDLIMKSMSVEVDEWVVESLPAMTGRKRPINVGIPVAPLPMAIPGKDVKSTA